MKAEYIEKIYAGWLAKIIGIRLGAPVENWTYEKIKNIYGELYHYPVDYKEFAADDDSNGPLFFLRALEDGRHGFDLKAQDVAEALLNYAPFEHGFFWWGGYGISTEHTAYLNLQNGIEAPRSGSLEQNGSTIAEQIGGQIFIDTWGLVTPGNPDRAAKFAREAASVTHDGNAVYGGIFVAVCISWAFVEKNICRIIEKGLSYIPEDCEYAKVVRAVMAYHEEHPENWRDCFHFIYDHYGYDRYAGICHIIPNIAVMILALLYGEGDFDNTLCICNMCGWDTDCNVGNVATIMGVRGGLEGIDYDKWRKPINDFLACSSVMGSMNITDIPYGAVYIARLAFALAGETMPEPWKQIAEQRMESCHFEFPGSTHAMRIDIGNYGEQGEKRESVIFNTTESAYTGEHSLKFIAKPVEAGEPIYLYKKTYYRPQDFYDSRYDPSFSPLIYPGQKLHGSAMLPEYGEGGVACLYVKDVRSGRIYEGTEEVLKKGVWKELEFSIPPLEGALLGEMGFRFRTQDVYTKASGFTAMIDDMYVDGIPNYSILFDQENEEIWTDLHHEISQFSRLKGLLYLEGGEMHLSSSDFGEAYTGYYGWKDYRATFCFTPLLGENHRVNVRVQGAIRSYAFGLLSGDRVAILKNDHGYRIMQETEYCWLIGKEYKVMITVVGNRITAEIDGHILTVVDEERPFLTGAIGVSVQDGSHSKYREIRISGT